MTCFCNCACLCCGKPSGAECDDHPPTTEYCQCPSIESLSADDDDADALAHFETLVQTQQPASMPWAPVTDYSFEARQAIEGLHPQLIADVFQPKRVLDVGCGPGHLVRLLRDLGVPAIGVDTSVTALQATWGTEGSPVMHLDITKHGGIYPLADLVVCREVVEHLTIRQIRQAVTNLCLLSSKVVYVTTRFAQHPTHLLDVDSADDLDPTHITLLNQNLLRVLFVLEGFKRRADLETRMDWKQLGRVLVYERA